MSKVKRALTVLLLTAVASCAPRPPAPAAPVAAVPPGFPSSFYSTVPREDAFRIVPSHSKLTVKVYRAGALASLGHNHVIASRQVDGFVYLADDMNKARADLFVPVASFVVDDAAERAAAGPDFDSQPTPSDIEGTRANMLGPKLLNAELWPFVVLHVVPSHIGPESTQVQLSITVHDHVAVIPVDAHWQRNGNELEIQSTFNVNHATLGLEPFSTLGGALHVADQISVSVSILARTAG